jgi:hypothetical protein
MQTNNSDKRLTQKDVAKQLGISTATLTRRLDNHEINFRTTESGLRYLIQQDVDDYLKQIKENVILDYNIPYIGDILNDLSNSLDDQQRHRKALKIVIEKLNNITTITHDKIKLVYIQLTINMLTDTILIGLDPIDFEEIVAQILIDLNYHLSSYSEVDIEEIKPARTTNPNKRFIHSVLTYSDKIDDGQYTIDTYEELKSKNIGKTDMETKYNMLRDLRQQLYEASLREPQDSRSANLAIFANGLTDELLDLSWVQFKTLIYARLQDIHKIANR